MQNLTASNPVVGKSKQELEVQNQKRAQLAEALEQLRLRRENIKQHGPVLYDSLWNARDDAESRIWIDFATNTVRSALGDVEAALL